MAEFVSPQRPTQLAFDAQAAVDHLAAADPQLAELMARCGPYAPSTTAAPDVFHSLMRAIVYQQLSGKAAGTIHRRLLDALGGGDTPGPERIAAADDATLRNAGLSRNKMLSLQALAAAQLAGELPDESRIGDYDDTQLIEMYSSIRGIGRWTVEMLLLFHLGRPDVMPIHDLGVRKGYALTYGLDELPKPKALEAACRIWQPYRSVGSWFMWRALEADGAAPQPG
ncbi:DNA-3-methyladenine glycosylase 2 family protein [Salinisphaera sp. T31B1]|uniref:DNA-3-methyladenine glycosylase family protein n=1 Tax=Salinisphaera sp. T31B1 TaxID=727963 RepID=UPI0033416E7B